MIGSWDHESLCSSFIHVKRPKNTLESTISKISSFALVPSRAPEGGVIRMDAVRQPRRNCTWLTIRVHFDERTLNSGVEIPRWSDQGSPLIWVVAETATASLQNVSISASSSGRNSGLSFINKDHELQLTITKPGDPFQRCEACCIGVRVALVRWNVEVRNQYNMFTNAWAFWFLRVSKHGRKRK
jgi:hypothetical protein